MQKIFLTALALCTFILTGVSFAKEPVNIEVAKLNVIRYHDSGAYDKDTENVITQALNYLEWRLTQQPTDGKPAIVLDIDETSLSNYRNLFKLNFSSSPTDTGPFRFTEDQPAIQPTLKLFRFAIEHDLPVFFLSGRHEKDRSVTERNLNKVGFAPYKGLILRADNDTRPNAIYKSNARKRLSEQGYNIILSIGDQQTDFIGGFTDKTFKLPNPYYLVT